LISGDYDEAVRFGQEGLPIARTLGDCAIEMVATSNLGETHAARGDFSVAATLLERIVAFEGDLRYERFGTPVIHWAASGAVLANVLSQLGRFDEAIGHAEAAVRIAEAAEHPFAAVLGVCSISAAPPSGAEISHARAPRHRGCAVPRDGHALLARTGRDDDD